MSTSYDARVLGRRDRARAGSHSSDEELPERDPGRSHVAPAVDRCQHLGQAVLRGLLGLEPALAMLASRPVR